MRNDIWKQGIRLRVLRVGSSKPMLFVLLCLGSFLMSSVASVAADLKPLEAPFPLPEGRMLDLRKGVNPVDLDGDGNDDWIVVTDEVQPQLWAEFWTQFVLRWPRAALPRSEGTGVASEFDLLQVSIDDPYRPDGWNSLSTKFWVRGGAYGRDCDHFDVRVFVDDSVTPYAADRRKIVETNRARVHVISAWRDREALDCKPARVEFRLMRLVDEAMETWNVAANGRPAGYPPVPGYKPRPRFETVAVYWSRKGYADVRKAMSAELGMPRGLKIPK